MNGTSTELQAVVDRRIGEVAAEIDPVALGRLMGERLLASIPEFSGSTDADFRAGIVMSCTSNVAEIRDALIGGRSLEAATPPVDATAWAHELVHRGMPLATLLRAYRLGHGLFEVTFEEVASRLDLEPEVRWRVLADAGRRLFTYIDTVCTQLVHDYETEREQWLRGAAAAQAEVVRAIVAGELIDARVAAGTLRYDVAGPQLGFIVWRDAHARAAPGATSLPAVARRLATELGGVQSLIVPLGEHVAWGWATGPDLVRAPPGRSASLGERATAAVGSPHEGLAGMARTHQEARSARRVGEIFGSRPGTVVRYAAIALQSLLSANPEEAANLVETELGELGGDGDAMLRLRATVLVYLDERLSPSRTARRLGVHQNTVAYRVRRAQELLGRPLDERRLELEVALRLYDGLDGLREQAGPSAGTDEPDRPRGGVRGRSG